MDPHGSVPPFGNAPTGYVPGLGRGMKADGKVVSQDAIMFGI